MFKKALLVSAMLLCFSGASFAQTTYPQTVVGSQPPTVNLGNLTDKCVYTGLTSLSIGQAIPIPCDSTGKLAVSASVSASINGFAPSGTYASPLSVSGTSANVALPAGSTVVVYNVGSTGAYVLLGTSNAITATVSDDYVAPGGQIPFTVGSNTFLAARTATGTTTLNLSGGSGLATATGGGGGGSSGGNVNLTQVGGTTYNLGSALSASSMPVVIASDHGAIKTTVAGGATSALQGTGNTSLASIVTNTSNTATSTTTTATNTGTTATNTGAVSTSTGAVTDTAYTSGSGSVISVLKGVFGQLATVVTNTTNIATSALQSAGNTTLSTISSTLTTISTNIATISGAVTSNKMATTTNPGTRTLVTLDVKTVTTGGTAVTALTAGHRSAGGWLLNPSGATADLCINEISTATGTTSSGDTTCVAHGQTYTLAPSGNAVSVITSDSTHPFSGYGYQ